MLGDLLWHIATSPFKRGPELTQSDLRRGFVTVLVTKAEDIETVEKWPEVDLIAWRPYEDAGCDVQTCE